MSELMKHLDAFLMLLLLGSGFGSYALLSSFIDLPQAANLMIAMGLRTASLIFYRFYAQASSQGTTLMQLLFEWLIPVMVIAELILAICVYPIDALCVWSAPWALSAVILFGLDIFTFFFLVSLLDSQTRLGPYGAFHISIIEAFTTLHTLLSHFVKTTPALSQLTSITRTPAPDPSIPLAPLTPVIDSVSTECAENQFPPPYSTYDSQSNCRPSNYSKYKPISEMV